MELLQISNKRRLQNDNIQSQYLCLSLDQYLLLLFKIFSLSLESLINSLSMKLTVSLPRTPHSLIKNVRCNGKDYLVPFPQPALSFIEIIQTIEVAREHEKMIAILSKKSNELYSVQQFYEIQEACLYYFNTKIELNTNDFVLAILSEPDKALKQLDKLRFADFLSVVKQGYDSLPVKLHAKLSRRIKKNLGDSKRSEAQQKKIRQLINLIKENSSEEDQVKSQPVFLKSIEKVDNITLPATNQAGKKNIMNPFKKQKGYESEEEKSPQLISNRDEKSEKSAPQSELLQSAAIESKKFKEENEPNSTQPVHECRKKVEDDWQDVKEEKENKRRGKNMMKKHLKNDRQKSEELPDEAFDQERSQPIIKETKPRRDKNRKEGQGKKKIFSNFKEKAQKDMRVLLGINGDTDDGWRERYRVSIIPQYDYKVSTKEQKNSKPVSIKEESNEVKIVIEQKKQIKMDNMELKKSEVIKIEAKQKSLAKIFTYPTDGEIFTLKPNESYNLLVNNLFWVKLEAEKVIIQKVGPDPSGFIRVCKFKSSDDYLLETEDLTLSLKGLSNLEDGGTKFGNPLTKDFTQNDSQWFKVRDLQVFGYV